MRDIRGCGSTTGMSMAQGYCVDAAGLSVAKSVNCTSQEMAGCGCRDGGVSYPGGEQLEHGPLCQQEVDTKAFTGKGNLHELRQLQQDVDRLELLMDQLVNLSRAVTGAQMYLAKHRRKRTGYVFLRWRETGGGKRHLSWQQAQVLWETYDGATRDWYAQLSKEVMQVNQQHIDARRRARAVLRQVQKQRRHVLARSISEQ